MKVFYYLDRVFIPEKEPKEPIGLSYPDFSESYGKVEISIKKGFEDEEGNLILEGGKTIYKTNYKIAKPFTDNIKGIINDENKYLIEEKFILCIYQDDGNYILKANLPQDDKNTYQFLKVKKDTIQEFLSS